MFKYILDFFCSLKKLFGLRLMSIVVEMSKIGARLTVDGTRDSLNYTPCRAPCAVNRVPNNNFQRIIQNSKYITMNFRASVALSCTQMFFNKLFLNVL